MNADNYYWGGSKAMILTKYFHLGNTSQRELSFYYEYNIAHIEFISVNSLSLFVEISSLRLAS